MKFWEDGTFGLYGLQAASSSSEEVERLSWCWNILRYLTNPGKMDGKEKPTGTAMLGTKYMPPEFAQTEQVKQQIKYFLEEINFDRSSPFLKDKELEATVWRYFQSLGLGETEKSAQRALKLAVTFTEQAYTALLFQAKVLCATQFLYMFLVDDIAEEFMEDLKSFGQKFILNKPHGHRLLEGLDSHLRELSVYYGPYCHSTIIKSLFDFVNGRIIEDKMERSNFKPCGDCGLMPMILKAKTGGAEILLHLMWPNSIFPEDKYIIKYFPPLQELVLFTDFTNDILSYHKEFVLRDEKGNFVSNFAESHDMGHFEVLKHLTSYTPKVLRSAYQMIEDSPDLVQSLDNFVRGLILLCTAHRRYYLVELFEDEQYLPPYNEDL